MRKINIGLGAIVVLLLTGCSSTPVVLEPVGPAPARGAGLPNEGSLKVYTATEPREDGDYTYYPHTGYHIYTDSGKLWKYIPNHVDKTDQSPMIVTIPAGNYKLLARADHYGRVTVPVVIKAGQMTEVNLKTLGRKRTSVTNEAAVVRLPNGYVVGWRAEELTTTTQNRSRP